MNSSQYMDKQIMDLSNSQTNNNNNNDFINLINTSAAEDDYKKEEILPNYDFQPIRSTINTHSPRVWTSADSKINPTSSANRNYGSLDSGEHAQVSFEKDRNVYDAALLSEIERTMKKHNDNLLHALEGVSARLSQLESRNRNLESSLDDLKVSVGNNHGSTDGKLRQLENILRDVETAVYDVKDKQEILEAQLQLAKLQVAKEQQSEKPSPVKIDHAPQAVSAPQQQLPPPTFNQAAPTHSIPNAQPPPPTYNQPPPSTYNQPPPSTYNQPPPTQSLPNAHLSQQNLPSLQQLPHQFSQTQVPHAPQQDVYFSPPVQVPEAPNQQYLLPQQQQQPPPPPPTSAPPQQQYQPSSLPLYSQPLAPLQHTSLSANNALHSQPQPPLGHQPEEAPYVPSQNFQPITYQPAPNMSGGVPSSQQFYGTPSQMHEPQSGRTGPGYSSAYGPSSGPNEQYPYGAPSSPYGRGASIKPQQQHSPSIAHSGGNAYPQLPSARILPQALPTASNVGSGSSSPGNGNGNKVPIDDVVDKVTTMGFPRDQVRATVRRLTENGQSVDLNVVLDKLMNDVDVQPPKGWFNR